jgi:hypothetical protein
VREVTRILQLGKGARRGFGRRSQIIGKIEAVHRQFQHPAFVVEEFRRAREVEQKGRQALADVLLAQRHDPRLCLAEIGDDLGQKRELQLRVLPHQLAHLGPGQAAHFCRRHRFRGIDITSRIGNAEHVARQAEGQNLALAIFRAAADADHAGIDKMHVLRGIALGIDDIGGATVDQRRDAPNVFLLLAGQKIGDRLLRGTGIVERPCPNFRPHIHGAPPDGPIPMSARNFPTRT